MKALILTGALALAVFAAVETSVAQTLPAGDYRKVSDLVELPEFIPGMGILYVQPSTLPAGPFLAYDRAERLVSTIYMLPLSAIEDKQAFENMAVGGARVDHVDVQYNAGHPGVAEPHLHVVLWHVPPAQAAALANAR